MSSQGSPMSELDPPPKQKIQRRHGACEPCRSSKTKCDGRMPCGACRSERRRQCPCVYSEKAMKLQQVAAEIRRRADVDNRSGDVLMNQYIDDEGHQTCYDNGQEFTTLVSANETEETLSRSDQDRKSLGSVMDSAKMTRTLSICGVVEEFKRLKVARGYSAQVVSRCDGFDACISSKMCKTSQIKSTNHVNVANCSSITSRNGKDRDSEGEIDALRSRLEQTNQLVEAGCLENAWAALGSIVREVESLQDTRGDYDGGSTSPAQEQIWHTVHDLEARIALTIGRPIGLPVTTPQRERVHNDALSLENSLDQTRIDLYQHIQALLSIDISSTRAIRDFLERASDTIAHEPFSQISLCTTDDHSAKARDTHLHTHVLFMIIYCRMATLSELFSRDLTNASWSNTPAADIIKGLDLHLHQTRKKLHYSRLMFRAANFIVDSFIGLHQDDDDDGQQIAQSWLRCHSAYIAATILGIAKLRHEVEWHATTEKLKKLSQIFSDLSQANPQSHLVKVALDRLYDLDSVKEPASEATRNKHTRMKNRKRSTPSSVQTSPRLLSRQSPHDVCSSLPTSPPMLGKRCIDLVDGAAVENRLLKERFTEELSPDADSFQQIHSVNTSFGEFGLDHSSAFPGFGPAYSQSSNSSFTAIPSIPSSATSFSESDLPLQMMGGIPQNHPGPPFAYPFPYNAYHPPMSWTNPTFTVDETADTPPMLHVPLDSGYGPGASPVARSLGTHFGLSDVQELGSSSDNTTPLSPLNTPSEGTVISPGLSPILRIDHEVKDVLSASGISNDASADFPILLSQNKTLSSNKNMAIGTDARLADREHISLSRNRLNSLPQDTLSVGLPLHSAVVRSHSLSLQRNPTIVPAPQPEQETTRDDVVYPHISNLKGPRAISYMAAGVDHPISHLHEVNSPFIGATHMPLAHPNRLFEPPHLKGSRPRGQMPARLPGQVTPNTGQLHDQWNRLSIGPGLDPNHGISQPI